MGTSPQAPARPLWERVESIRRDNGWTVEQLAERAGVERSTINRWKTQRRPPNVASVRAVAEGLGIDYNEALELAGITRGDVPAETFEDRLAATAGTEEFETVVREALEEMPESDRVTLEGILSELHEIQESNARLRDKIVVYFQKHSRGDKHDDPDAATGE